MGLPDSIPLNPALDRAAIPDGRARFREILHAVNSDKGEGLPDARATGDILRDLGGEGAPSGKTVALDPLPATVRVVGVSGYLTECVAFLADVLTDGMAHLRTLGCQTTRARLDGRGGAVLNAKRLRDQISVLPRNETLILITMSKGTVDTQEMFARYPETHGRVAAQVSLVGAVCGSPLAHLAPDWLKWVEKNLPLPSCRPHGGEAVHDLMPETRLAFLQSYQTPATVRSYTLGAAVDVDAMSAGMLSSYRALARDDALNDTLNDGQMLLGDQAVPGSTYLGVLNGDHIAVGMPFNRNTSALGRWVADKILDQNAFPREVLCEAIVRQVLEDL